MDLMEKLKILTDAAKYDAACTSSGLNKKAQRGGIGCTEASGLCHSFAGDGRCITLLKVLLTNYCVFDCAYCLNRRSNDVRRIAFTPRELADLTMQFYRRNYIEGLFLSSGILKSPDYTCEQMIATLKILREEYKFSGYIHAKAIPGADQKLLAVLGYLADRMSINIELPSSGSLAKLAPDKSKTSLLNPMGYLAQKISANTRELVRYKTIPKFAPAGQSTQMIIGASPETDWQILQLTEGLYHHYKLKRVFYSAYVPVVANPLLPAVSTPPPLWREHRLYQADWLFRYYGFQAGELLDEGHQTLHPYLDPKCQWALRHSAFYPLEVNKADLGALLRVPGIGVTSALRIVKYRRNCALTWEALKKIGVVVKRARYFLLCQGKRWAALPSDQASFLASLMSPRERKLYQRREQENQQPTLFADNSYLEGGMPALSARERSELECLSIPVL